MTPPPRPLPSGYRATAEQGIATGGIRRDLRFRPMKGTRMSTPKPPTGLGKRGRALWLAVTSDYSLRPDELLTLHELARCADAIDSLEEELRGAPLMVPGSAGQLRPHPLLAELRGHRQVFAQLARLMGLSDVPEEGEDGQPLMTPRQARAQHAARARWGHRGA